jgi:hypothetical protein
LLPTPGVLLDICPQGQAYQGYSRLDYRVYTKTQQLCDFPFCASRCEQKMSENTCLSLTDPQLVGKGRTIIIPSQQRSEKFVNPQNTLITVYHALITPHLNYQLLSWGYDSTNILRLQKKAIRVITRSHFLYKFFKNDLPGYFMHNTFKTNNQIHLHNTRNRQNLVTHFCRHNFAKLRPIYSAVNIYNSLPP